MKFEREKTDKSKRRLKKVFYFTFCFWLSTGLLRLLKSSGILDIGPVNSILLILSLLCFVVLLIVYVIHIFIEGSEKPKFKPTKTHNKIKNENAASGTDAQKDARPCYWR